MKIYTRTGDDGTTGLIGGRRLRKSDPRIACYGTVDELNAALGMAGASASSGQLSQIRDVQDDLFVIGAHLATPVEKATPPVALPVLEEEIVKRLEAQIDAAEADLPSLRQFILPGGTETAVRLHFARTVCRRAERLLVELADTRPVAPLVLRYLNRLSDWLFVQARRANREAGVEDVPWSPRKRV